MPPLRHVRERWIALSLGALLSIAAAQANLGSASPRAGTSRKFQLTAQSSGSTPTTVEPSLDPRRWSEAKRTGAGLAPEATGPRLALRGSAEAAERHDSAWRSRARRALGARAPPR